MPRTNPTRSVVAERRLAARIKAERNARGWSLEQLAAEMRAAGCSIDRSAIYRIERGDPPRRITVDEGVGFSEVFNIPLERMLQ